MKDLTWKNLPLSVAGLTEYIKTLLEEDFYLKDICVTGEVSDARLSQTGHLYFDLIDTNNSAGIIKCVVWKSLISKLANRPTNQKEFIIWGHLALYLPHGKYQLIVDRAKLVGEGLQSQRFQQLKNRLEAEGLFSQERKKPLPPKPQTIAVITSPQAAAWGDIQRTLKQRHPGLTILLSPCLVQGEEAPASIVTALTRVEKDHRAEVIILSRGGGASDDLSCFNDERVVLSIAHCSIPIITGIGHERDRTLADLVADVAVSTPTAAAQKAVPELSAMIQQERQALLWKRQRLLQATKRDFQRTRQHFQYLKEKLIALHPQKVLERGYAIVRTEEGSIAYETTLLNIGQELLIQLGEGVVKVQVTEITPPPSYPM